MKRFIVVLALSLSACVTIEMPGVVSDLVKATKDVYNGKSADKTESANRAATRSARPVIAHSYLGQPSQPEAEIKRLCVAEAAQMLDRIAGKEVAYGVLKNDVVVLNSHAFANCELAVED